MGRPSDITHELTQAICADIRRGCYLKVAAGRHGIRHVTLNEWLKRGEADAQAGVESLYAEAWRAVEEAKAAARFNAETRVYDTDAKWWLSRGYARHDWRTANELEALAQELAEVKEQLAQLQARQEGGADL